MLIINCLCGCAEVHTDGNAALHYPLPYPAHPAVCLRIMLLYPICTLPSSIGLLIVAILWPICGHTYTKGVAFSVDDVSRFQMLLLLPRYRTTQLLQMTSNVSQGEREAEGAAETSGTGRVLDGHRGRRAGERESVRL